MSRASVCAGVLSVLFATTTARTAEKALEVTASCERKMAKGRVLCEVELEAATGRIAWADVVVRQAPPFAPPLRSRVAMTEARVRTDRRIRIPVALVATTTGRGMVVLQARAALCEGPAARELCRAVSEDVTTELVVGADVEH
jgi:hypothetical protein